MFAQTLNLGINNGLFFFVFFDFSGDGSGGGGLDLFFHGMGGLLNFLLKGGDNGGDLSNVGSSGPDVLLDGSVGAFSRSELGLGNLDDILVHLKLGFKFLQLSFQLGLFGLSDGLS